MKPSKHYKKVDTQALISSCLDGDPIAWSEFMSRFSPLSERAIRKRLGSHNFQYSNEDVKDLKQGLFMKLWQEKALAKVKDAPNIKFWICFVSANFATDFYRRSKSDMLNNALSTFDEIVVSNKTICVKDIIKSNIPSARKKMDQKRIDAKIESALSGLSPKEKIAVKLNMFHDKKYWEISKVLKISIGTAASLLNRAKKKIKEKISSIDAA